MEKDNVRRRLLGVLLTVPLLHGCESALMDPKGMIGLEQRSLIITATWLMLIVVIPVFIMTFFFAWRYRVSNKKATYQPDWSHSTKIEWVVWTIPCLIILALGALTWTSTHALDPRKPIYSESKPLVIEAISLDWKWLFIYPEQQIATINEIAFPVNVPVEFKVTSGSVMNSFFIPQLGSQIYAMAGMQNHVHLIANTIGDYKGISANYSGAGFSGMKFIAHATTVENFQVWVSKVRQSPHVLQWTDYQALAKPSTGNPVTYYSFVKSGLNQDIINQFMVPNMQMRGDHGHEMAMPDAQQTDANTHSSHSAEHGE